MKRVVTNPRRRGRRDGFSLVEILIVIGIIMLLMAIGVYGYRSLERSNSVKQTKVALASGDSMLKEMNSTGGLSMIEGPADRQPAPVFQTGAKTDVATALAKTQQVMSVLLTNPNNKKAFENMPSGMTYVKPGGAAAGDPRFLADAWGKQLIYVPSGGITGVKFEAAGTQTVTSPGNRPFWMSGGPDGDITTGDDNVLSFQSAAQ